MRISFQICILHIDLFSDLCVVQAQLHLFRRGALVKWYRKMRFLWGLLRENWVCFWHDWQVGDLWWTSAVVTGDVLCIRIQSQWWRILLLSGFLGSQTVHSFGLIYSGPAWIMCFTLSCTWNDLMSISTARMLHYYYFVVGLCKILNVSLQTLLLNSDCGFFLFT